MHQQTVEILQSQFDWAATFLHRAAKLLQPGVHLFNTSAFQALFVHDKCENVRSLFTALVYINAIHTTILQNVQTDKISSTFHSSSLSKFLPDFEGISLLSPKFET